MSRRRQLRPLANRSRGAGARIPHGYGRAVGLSIAPAVVMFGIFFVIPLGILAVTAFSHWGGIAFGPAGFDNFVVMFGDPVFWTAAGNTLFYAAISLFVQVPLGVAVAIILSLRPRGWRAIRTVVFIPFVISGAAYALIFSLVYNARFGLLNETLGFFGLPADRDWLYTSDTARWAVAGTYVFLIGFLVVLVMAEIGAIPRDLFEAAAVDGASTWKQQWLITIPLLRNVIGTCVLIRLLGDLGMFDLVYILTSGGPNDSTATLALYAYRAYVTGQWGYANAVGAVILALGLVLILGVRRVFKLGEPVL